MAEHDYLSVMLPDELVVAVSLNLGTPRQVVSMALTCRWWDACLRQNAERVWNMLLSKNFPQLEALYTMLLAGASSQAVYRSLAKSGAIPQPFPDGHTFTSTCQLEDFTFTVTLHFAEDVPAVTRSFHLEGMHGQDDPSGIKLWPAEPPSWFQHVWSSSRAAAASSLGLGQRQLEADIARNLAHFRLVVSVTWGARTVRMYDGVATDYQPAIENEY